MSSNGTQANAWMQATAITPGGRFVILDGWATNLVSGDSNGRRDVFLRDRVQGTTERVSVSSDGAQGNGDSLFGYITPDGRYVAFTSAASNLVSSDGNGAQDAFVRDRRTGRTELVSRNTAGDIGNGFSGCGPMTPDGRYVCFASYATNLAAGVPNGYTQVYVRDRLARTTEIVSISSAANVGNSDSYQACISDDGRFVAFVSFSSNLVSGDTNLSSDAFVHDRQTGSTERVSLTANGSQANGGSYELAISGDGRFVAFNCDGSNLVQGTNPYLLNLYLRDRQQHTTELLNLSWNGAAGHGDCFHPSISGDGRIVAFESTASNLVPGDTNRQHDIFVRDRAAGTTTRESVDSQGVQGDDDSMQPAVSADGRYVVYSSSAANLVPGGDVNLEQDGFVRDRVGGPEFASLCSPGQGSVLPCPCANPPSGIDRGCDNSSATGGATLTAAGGAFLTSDSLVLSTSGENPTALSIVSQWTRPSATGSTFGMGVRCASGTFKRLYSKAALGGSITAPDFSVGDPQISVRSEALGDLISAGERRWYLVSYRDPNVLGGCPASSTFNATQTGEILWLP